MKIYNFIKPHIFWVMLIATGLLLGHSWLQEHDARMLADAQIKQSQTAIQQLTASNEQLRQQVAASDSKTQKAVQVLQTSAAKVKTPQEAVIAIPDVSTLPLRPLPLSDGRVSVDALQLYTELNACQQVRAQLEGCQAARSDDEKIIQNDNKESMMQKSEIAALKQRPNFWHRVASTAKQVGVGIGIGILIGGKL